MVVVSWEKLGSWAELVNPVDNVMYPRVETGDLQQDLCCLAWPHCLFSFPVLANWPEPAGRIGSVFYAS